MTRQVNVLYVGDGEYISKLVVKTVGFYVMGEWVEKSNT